MKNQQKGFMVPLLIIVTAVLAIGTGIYVYTQNMESELTPSTNTATTSREFSTNNLVTNTSSNTLTAMEISRENLENLKTGDSVGKMTVVSIGRLKPERTDILLSLNARVVFSGETTLSGKYEYFDDNAGFLFGEVCFTPDEGSKNKLPSFTDSGKSFFCFSNQATAQELFGPKGSSGKATVTIDNYNLVYLESEVWNTAELVSRQ